MDDQRATSKNEIARFAEAKERNHSRTKLLSEVCSQLWLYPLECKSQCHVLQCRAMECYVMHRVTPVRAIIERLGAMSWHVHVMSCPCHVVVRPYGPIFGTWHTKVQPLPKTINDKQPAINFNGTGIATPSKMPPPTTTRPSVPPATCHQQQNLWYRREDGPRARWA